jgi:hypothetical protein
MKLFVGYGYNDRDQWIEEQVFPILQGMWRPSAISTQTILLISRELYNGSHRRDLL